MRYEIPMTTIAFIQLNEEEIIYCILQATHDHFDVSRVMLNTLEFKILDSYRRVVDLRGVPVSFSMIFMLRTMD